MVIATTNIKDSSQRLLSDFLENGNCEIANSKWQLPKLQIDTVRNCLVEESFLTRRLESISNPKYH